MTWLVFVLAFQLGYLPTDQLQMYSPPSFIDGSGQFYQQAEVKAVLWDTVEVGGALKVYDWINKEGLSFWPSQLDSTFFVSLLLGPVKLGWIHVCQHPVTPWSNYTKRELIWEGVHEEFFARVELKGGF